MPTATKARTVKKAAAKRAPSRAASHPLAHTILDPKLAREYVSRKVHGGVQDLKLLSYARAVGKHVMIYGPTGAGKTSCIRAFAAAEQLPIVTIHAHGAADPNTFWGMLRQNLRTGNIEWVDADITEVIRAGEAILYVNEVNFLHPKATAVLHPLLDGTRAIRILEKGNELVPVGPNLLVVCDFNPNYEGTRPMSPAFKNRFAIKIPWDYDREVEAKLICMPTLRDIAEQLREQHRSGDIETPVGTNMLVEFEEFALDINVDFAISNFVAAFHEDEVAAVSEVMALNADKINVEFVEMKAAYDEANADEDD